MLIGVTGATGFIGQLLVQQLNFLGTQICFAVRREVTRREHFESEVNVETIDTDEIDNNTDCTDFLTDVECIIHCTGRAHIR